MCNLNFYIKQGFESSQNALFNYVVNIMKLMTFSVHAVIVVNITFIYLSYTLDRHFVFGECSTVFENTLSSITWFQWIGPFPCISS